MLRRRFYLLAGARDDQDAGGLSVDRLCGQCGVPARASEQRRGISNRSSAQGAARRAHASVRTSDITRGHVLLRPPTLAASATGTSPATTASEKNSVKQSGAG